MRSPGVTTCSSAPCRPHTPWSERWMGRAFVAIVPTRPCPLFGRPVHRRGSPHRLRPGASPHALRIPPRGGHPALLSLDGRGQRGITPAFGYSAPHPSASGTSTHLSTLLPSAHYVSTDTFRAASLVAAHATDGEEENHFYALNSALSAGRIGGFHLRHLWKKTFVSLRAFYRHSTDRCFLYACYGNPNCVKP
jgi:hypothetical protein